MKETKKPFIFILSIFLFIAFMLAMLLVLCIPVKAASPSGTFPYVVPLYSDLNSSIPSDIYLQADSLVRQTYNLSDSDTVIWYIDTYDIIVDELGEYGQNSLTFLINPSTRGYSDSFDYLSSTVNVNFPGGGTIEFRWTGSVRGPYGFGGGTKVLLGPVSSSSISHGSITRLYPFYMSGPEVLGYPLQDGGNDPIATIFTNTVPVIPEEFQTGHAVEPSYDSDTIIDSGLHPNLKPTFPTINNYSFTTYVTPTLDTSSLENIMKSVYDAVVYNGQYLAQNIGGAINNLTSNISNMFGYVSDLGSYLVQRIINTIKQTASNLFDNFKGLFEPVLNSFANFINMMNTLYSLGLEDGVFSVGHLGQALFVPDQTELNSFLENHLELSVVGHAQETTGVLLHFMNDVIESDPIYEIHLPRFYFYDRYMGGYTISFDWYLDIKPTMDTIISGFLIVGYFFWLFVRLPGILHGTAPDSSDASKLMKDLDIKG